MRLLFFTLPLLLAASTAVLAAPTEVTPEDAHTSIETISETVTRTIIHEVTEPTVVADFPAKTEDSLEKANARMKELQEQLDHAQHVVDSLARGAGNATVAPTVAADAVTGATPAANTTTTQCSCKQAEECRVESDNEMGTCMNGCYNHIESFGNKTEEYSKCFSKFNATILEAEECLFDKKSDFCNNGTETKTIDTTNWDELSAFTYTAEVTKDNNNTIWKKHEPKYTKLQSFFTCTKHCMHKKFGACTATKGCAVKMPAQDDFETKMNKCTKKNWKITNAMFNTCSCLAWQNKNNVKELQGSCVFVGNQHYIDRA